jgi:hypothetical protein
MCEEVVENWRWCSTLTGIAYWTCMKIRDVRPVGTQHVTLINAAIIPCMDCISWSGKDEEDVIVTPDARILRVVVDTRPPTPMPKQNVNPSLECSLSMHSLCTLVDDWTVTAKVCTGADVVGCRSVSGFTLPPTRESQTARGFCMSHCPGLVHLSGCLHTRNRHNERNASLVG